MIDKDTHKAMVISEALEITGGNEENVPIILVLLAIKNGRLPPEMTEEALIEKISSCDGIIDEIVTLSFHELLGLLQMWISVYAFPSLVGTKSWQYNIGSLHYYSGDIEPIRHQFILTLEAIKSRAQEELERRKQ